MTTKEITAHIRKRLKHEGIAARVSFYKSCGACWVKVTCPAIDSPFSDEAQATIKHVARCNHLTMSRGQAIPEDHVNPMDFHFVYNPARTA